MAQTLANQLALTTSILEFWRKLQSVYKSLTTVFHHSFKIEALSLDLKSVHASLYIKVYPISVHILVLPSWEAYFCYQTNFFFDSLWSSLSVGGYYCVVIFWNRKSSHRERRLLTVFTILVKTVVTPAVSSPEAWYYKTCHYNCN